MKKRLKKCIAIIAVAAMAMVSALFTPAESALAADSVNAWTNGKTEKNVKYLDENGQTQICPEARVLTDGDQDGGGLFGPDYYDIDAGWYVVYGDAYFYMGWNVHGDVHLILADGCHLEIDSNEAGIYVNGGDSITIYGQSDIEGKARLTVDAKDGAGIGGEDGEVGEHITINGGTIYASAVENSCGAGIGGGEDAAGRDITINGGYVTATGNKGGAGIGGGADGDGENIIVNGGTIGAYGGGESSVSYDGGAGIGGGDGEDGIGITVTGGTVRAFGGGGSAGIGGGSEGDGKNIRFLGGYVEANGGLDDDEYGGAGIGGGDEGDGSDIYVSGSAYIVSRGAKHAAGIGGGDSEGSGYDITIAGGTVYAYGGEYGAGIGGGDEGSGHDITLLGGDTYAIGNNASSVGSGNSGSIDKIYMGENMVAYPSDSSETLLGEGTETAVRSSFFAHYSNVTLKDQGGTIYLYYGYNAFQEAGEMYYDIYRVETVNRVCTFTEDLLEVPEGLSGSWYRYASVGGTGVVTDGEIKIGDVIVFDKDSYGDDAIIMFGEEKEEAAETVTLHLHYDEETVVDQELVKGQTLNTGDIPRWPGLGKAVGWYYDEAFEKTALATDVIEEETHLYAKYRYDQPRFGATGSVFADTSLWVILAGGAALVAAGVAAAVIVKKKKAAK